LALTLKSPRPLVINIDGACSPNPGPAAAAALCDDGRAPVTEFIGESTSNVAEYRALHLALDVAGTEPARAIVVRTDSGLVVGQVRDGWTVNASHLAPLVSSAKTRVGAHGNVTIEQISREQNTAADSAATAALAAGKATPRDTWPIGDVTEPSPAPEQLFD
jgi:ribonuclease HI